MCVVNVEFQASDYFYPSYLEDIFTLIDEGVLK